MVINCSLCGDFICKRSSDFDNCGGFTVDVGDKDNEMNKDLCRKCMREIMKEGFEEMIDKI